MNIYDFYYCHTILQIQKKRCRMLNILHRIKSG